MGHSDPKQRQLSFEAGKTLRKDDSEGASDYDQGQVDGAAAIMAELKAGFQSIDARLDTLNSRLDDITSRLDAQGARLDGAEHRISEIEDSHPIIHKRLDRAEGILKQLATKAEDLEARSHRNNLCLAGVAESTNTGQMTKYIETLLMELFGREAFSTTFAVERAHRSLGPLPPLEATPRVIVARLLNYADRDTALRLSRERGTLSYQGSTISLFPDFTPFVQDARRKYSDVKRMLQKANIKYSMLYPARLKVQIGNKSHIFDTPDAVTKYWKSHPQTTAANE